MAWTVKVLGTVTPDEMSDILEAQAEIAQANAAQQRASIASSEANTLLQAINIRLARKYKLNQGDRINPETGEIQRDVHEDASTEGDGGV